MNCKYDNCTNEIKYKNKQLCSTHYNYEWKLANPDKVKQRTARYYQNNREKVLASNSEWRKANPDAVRRQARHYMAKNSQNPVTEEHMTDRVKERFFAKVDKTDTCWNWTAARTAYRPKRAMADATVGYGTININNRPFYAHRASWLMHKGPLTQGLVIDHVCENTLCVNPDHLRELTNNENTTRSAKHTKNGAKYNYYKTHCKYGHERTVEYRSKPCPACYQNRLKRARNSRHAV